MRSRHAARTILFAAALAYLVGAPARAQSAQPIPDAPCTPHDSADVAVTSVTDGRTFKTTDGREVRLAAIEPIAGRHDDAAQDEAARAALARLLGTAVELVPSGTADRYGRLVASTFRRGSGTPSERSPDSPSNSRSWVERDLVAEGYAVAGGAAVTGACLSHLLEAEGEARTARRGLWADPNFAIRNADDGAALVSGQGRFIISQGKVLSVREVGGTIYVNFGRIWRRSLTVTIGKRRERAFNAAGIEPKRLEGHQVRVRGWLDRRIGPTIEAERPEQIELID